MNETPKNFLLKIKFQLGPLSGISERKSLDHTQQSWSKLKFTKAKKVRFSPKPKIAHCAPPCNPRPKILVPRHSQGWLDMIFGPNRISGRKNYEYGSPFLQRHALKSQLRQSKAQQQKPLSKHHRLRSSSDDVLKKAIFKRPNMQCTVSQKLS